MIDESGAVVPDVEEINLSIDEQFKKTSAEKGLIKCDRCEWFGDITGYNYHRIGMGH